MTKAILFDFDGVIVQSEKLHMKTFLDLFEKYGLKISEEKWFSTFAGTGSRYIIEVLVKELGVNEDVDKLVKIRKEKYEERVKAGELELTAGVVEFLDEIKRRKIKTAIVSGSHRTNVELALKTFSLEKYFDTIVSGDDIKERKPSPEPFLFGARALKVDPKDCIAVEDSKAGCMSVVAAGIKLVIVKSPISKDLKIYKSPIIDDFTKFPMNLL